MDIKARKKELRAALLAQRDALSETEKVKRDSELCRKLYDIIVARKAKVIHSYLPFGSEPDIRPLLHDLLATGRTIVCPKSLPKRELRNLVLSSLNETEEGRFGTRHPAGDLEHSGDIDLFIVPGVAFDHQHYRLGYGAGYYDTFFGANPGGYKAGICYDFQILSDFPVEAHDVPLDEVVYA